MINKIDVDEYAYKFRNNWLIDDGPKNDAIRYNEIYARGRLPQDVDRELIRALEREKRDLIHKCFSLKAHLASSGVYSNVPEIKKVIFNGPCTIVLWEDKTKTVVRCENEEFDKEKGLAMAICKKMMGNTGRYFETFKKYTREEE